ncbi:hypothetical protein LZ554_008128 [Drepanopeziza brunnea f. sp. 'monogermtubi']|nr:hypothetical protein LZ554_008128 [Drepanopeziza brunnea f. sp. 'monogermtubi']
MSVSEDLIDFEIIENQKENIQSLPQGRSARALASMFSPSPLHKLNTPTPSDTQNLHDVMRNEYENELLNISESDDPLDIYDRYVRWTLDAYPSAQATPASQLLPLLERATKTFQNSAQYKNDPRYLKLWLSYIRFFSDAPRETFAFLARHNIGEGLALFYEEFAAWLEGAGRWTQAEEVYKMGIEKEARPTPRLLRKYNEFQQRFEQRPADANEPSSPALPTVRPALAAKIDPYAAAAVRDPQAPRPSSGVGGGVVKSGKPKLQIFSDAGDAGPTPGSSEGTKGWESIGSLADRKKENVMEPKPWVGETMKAGGKKSSTKLAVFKDENSLPTCLPTRFNYPQVTDPAQQQVTVNPKGRMERVHVNLEAIYPTPDEIGSELSLEELRAISRGWLSKVWEPENAPTRTLKTPSTGENSWVNVDTVAREVSKLVLARDPPALDENGVAKPKGRRMKLKEVNETQIIKAKLSSPSGPKMKKRKASKEQTVTLHTRAAMDDIYDLFNQTLPASGGQVEEEIEDEDEDEESEDDDDMTTDGDYTSGGESTGTGRLLTTSEAGDDDRDDGDDETSDVKSVSEWSEFTARKHIPDLEDDEDTRGSRATDTNDESLEVNEVGIHAVEEHEELSTPISQEPPAATRTSFVPVPPEDYEPPLRPYRDATQVSQNKLPFMTPIAEKTESTLGLPTMRHDKNYFASKTPSRGKGSRKPPVRLENLGSSPFKELIDESKPTGRIPQPQLGKSNKAKATPLAPKVAPLAKSIVQTGPIIKDAQCNPVDDYTRSQILEALHPPLSSYGGFFDHSSETLGRTNELKKYAKAISKMSKNSSDKTATNLSVPPILQFPGIERKYMVKRELGAGAFAPVYLLESIAAKEVEDHKNPNMIPKKRRERKRLEALKMEEPPSAWEFHITRQAKLRLSHSRVADSVIDVYEMHLYADECYLIEEFRDQGTLLDIINLARMDVKPTSAGPGVMDESLVMFFAIELFRTVESLHAQGILHGDLKADNCLVRLDAIPDDNVWSQKYRRDGSGGWGKKGVALIDFGRGIDMRNFRPDVQFIADWKTGPADCAEMRELRPWTYQIDYHGLAGIIHSMLFGKYIDTIADKSTGLGGNKSWRIREGLKRYWQTEIWSSVFDLLLNPTANVGGEEGGKMPALKGMRGCRERMEEWLEGNSEKGQGLQAGLRRLEQTLGSRKKWLEG